MLAAREVVETLSQDMLLMLIRFARYGTVYKTMSKVYWLAPLHATMFIETYQTAVLLSAEAAGVQEAGATRS